MSEARRISLSPTMLLLPLLDLNGMDSLISFIKELLLLLFVIASFFRLYFGSRALKTIIPKCEAPMIKVLQFASHRWKSLAVEFLHKDKGKCWEVCSSIGEFGTDKVDKRMIPHFFCENAAKGGHLEVLMWARGMIMLGMKILVHTCFEWAP